MKVVRARKAGWLVGFSGWLLNSSEAFRIVLVIQHWGLLFLFGVLFLGNWVSFFVSSGYREAFFVGGVVFGIFFVLQVRRVWRFVGMLRRGVNPYEGLDLGWFYDSVFGKGGKGK